MVWGCAVMDTPTSVENDPAHLRLCADRARQTANQETDPITTETLLAIAEAYEKLAALTETKLASARPE